MIQKMLRDEPKRCKKIGKQPERKERTNPVIGVSVNVGSGDVADAKALKI